MIKNVRLGTEFKSQAYEIETMALKCKVNSHQRACLFRTAISRAYYSCFHLGLDRCEKDKWLKIQDTGVDHKSVRLCLKYIYTDPAYVNSSKKNEVTYLDVIISRLKRSRTMADYYVNVKSINIEDEWNASKPLFEAFHGYLYPFKNESGVKPIVWSENDAINEFMNKSKAKAARS